MTDPRLLDHLEDILIAVAKIRRYVTDMSREDFGVNELVQDATIRNFEIIGEASNRIASRFPEFAAAHPAMELAKARAMRNFVAHDYSNVDLTVVWETIHADLPTLATATQAALDGLEPPTT